MAEQGNDPFSAGDTLSITMGGDVERESSDALSTDDIAPIEDLNDDGLEGDANDADGSDNDAGDDESLADADEGDEDGNDEEATDLGDFDPENVEAWDNQYLTSDGEYNQEALTAEFDANEGGGLNEGTYAYLASRGVSKEFAQQIEAALVTQRDAQSGEASKKHGEQELQLMTLAGGPDVLKSALDWGKGVDGGEGGYSPEAQKRFTATMEGDDMVAKEEAVELLMSRYNKANAVSKPKVPRRDVTKGSGKPSKQTIQPFKSREDYHAALEAAGDNQKAVRGVTRRWVASPARKG